jgi:hypothetical protein
MRLAIRVCALFIVAAFGTHSAWAGGHKSGSHTSGTRTVHVNGYYRKDGTYVHAYDRAAPGTASSLSATATKPSRHVPTTSSTSVLSGPATAIPVPVATPDLWSDKRRLQDAVAAGRIVVKDTKPVVTSTTTSVSASGVVVRDANGKIKRNQSAKHEFMRQTGYSNGRPGYVVDHIIPLKRGGCDCPSNMQWQTIQEAKAKDKWE